MQNRHSKGNSKEADDNPGMEESSYSRGGDKSRREQKRGPKESGISARKREREREMEMQTNVDGGGRKSFKKGRHSKFINHEGQGEGQGRASVKKNMRLRREAVAVGNRGGGKRKQKKKQMIRL